jgi:predicted GNAT family acetyltransferase
MVTVRRLTENDRGWALEYVMAQPDHNLFIIGDIENFGFDGEEVQTFAGMRNGKRDFLMLRYLDNWIFFSHHPDFDASAAAGQIKRGKFRSVNGKADVTEKLLPCLSYSSVKRMHLARLDRVLWSPLPQGAELRRLGPEDAEKLIGLYLEIDEFRDKYSQWRERETEALRKNLSSGGRSYGAFKDGRLVSAASTAAENSISAMVIGVATLPPERKKSLASAIVAKLCGECLAEGREFLCLYYDSPDAGGIYRKIGFYDVGEYLIIQS